MTQVVEKRKELFQIIFISFSITMALFFLLLILAMIFYPGGNFFGSDIENYSIIYNGLCDMKEALAVNGEPNLLSSTLLKIGIVFCSVGTTFFFTVLCFFFQGRKSTKILSIFGSIFGVAQGPLLAFIILLPAAFKVHMVFVILGPLFQYLAVILYTIVYFIDRGLPKINKYSFLILSITAIFFMIFVGIVNPIGGDLKFITNRLGTNLFNFLSVIIYMIQGIGLYLYLHKKKEVPLHLVEGFS